MSFHQSGPKSSAWVSLALAFVLAGIAGAFLQGGSWSVGAGIACVAVACAIVGLQLLQSWLTSSEVVTPWERVRREIERSRRHNSSLVVARLPLQSAPTGAVRHAADHAEMLLRGNDAVWVEDGSLFLLLADTDRESAHNGIDRVVDELEDMPTAEPVVASFPEDVLTLGGLMDQLYPPRRVRPLATRRTRDLEPRPVEPRPVRTPLHAEPTLAYVEDDRQASAS